MTCLLEHLAWQLMLAPGNTHWKSMGRSFRGRRAMLDSNDLSMMLLILTGIVLAVFLLSRFLSRQDRQKSYNSPRALFCSLTKAHELDRKSRRLLRQVARWQRLAHPARLFLEPWRFEPVNLSPPLRKRLDEIQALRDHIFGARIEDLDLDRPGGHSPKRGDRHATVRTNMPRNETQTPPKTPTKTEPAPQLPASMGNAAPPIQTDVSNFQGDQPTGA